MRRKLCLAVVSGALGIVLIAPGSASADYWIKCGDDNQTGAGWFDAKGHNVNCRKTRNVARSWHQLGGDSPGRWRCKFRSTGYELGVVTCKRTHNGQREVVRFKTGS
jgi:hypothetical protein